jgi:PTH1 family peptidyl-tRNA hydrolase
MYYIVGLGNPGEKYQDTRHNVGWAVLDFVCERAPLSNMLMEKALSGRTTSGIIAGHDVAVLYPETFMNNSGSAVAKFVPTTQVQNLIVIHDDIDLPFGEIKLGKGRGDGGNNGIKSIIEKLNTKDFIRIRIGIAPRSFWTGEVKRPKGGGPLEAFVLKPFTKKEQEQLDEIKTRAYGALQAVLTNGLESAMNTYNQVSEAKK